MPTIMNKNFLAFMTILVEEGLFNKSILSDIEALFVMEMAITMPQSEYESIKGGINPINEVFRTLWGAYNENGEDVLRYACQLWMFSVEDRKK